MFNLISFAPAKNTLNLDLYEYNAFEIENII